MRIKILLIILLLSVILLYKVSFSEEVEPIQYYNESDLFILAQSPPYFIENEVSGSLIANTYYDLIDNYSWDAEIAHRFMLCESSANPEATNWKDKHKGCNGSFGLFQIGCIHFKKYNITDYRELYDPERNIEIAFSVYQEQGWDAWKKCKNKIY